MEVSNSRESQRDQLAVLTTCEVVTIPRPRKWRRVCSLPQLSRFGPLDIHAGPEDVVYMTVDEYETIRLIDLEDFTQEECAEQMNIGRTTVQGIYSRARRKLAEALVEGKMLVIEGGEVMLCEDWEEGCGRGCRRRRRGRHA